MISRIRRSMEENDRGFTLIELLVVMIIIGILAAIAIPVFLNQRKSAVDASIKSDLRTIATAMETTFVDTQVYPTPSGTAPALTVGTQSVTTSTGNAFTYVVGTTGFCIRGTNATGNATSASTTTIITYSSLTGGLKVGTAACPTSIT